MNMSPEILLAIAGLVISFAASLVLMLDALRKFKCEHKWSDEINVYDDDYIRPVEIRRTCFKCGKRIKR